MNFMFGTVSEIVDDHKFVIKFTTKEVIENAIAYPIDTFDEPNIGDPVWIISIETIFGYSFMWKKLRLFDYTRLKLLDSRICLCHDHILFQVGGEESAQNGDEAAPVFVRFNVDGTIVVKSTKSVTVETPEVYVKGTTKIDVETPDYDLRGTETVDIETPAYTLKGNDTIDIKGGTITVTGKEFKTKAGTCSPTGTGGFCAIPVCPLSGAPHIGNSIKAP